MEFGFGHHDLRISLHLPCPRIADAGVRNLQLSFISDFVLFCYIGSNFQYTFYYVEGIKNVLNSFVRIIRVYYTLYVLISGLRFNIVYLLDVFLCES